MEQRETRAQKNNCGGAANLYPFPHKFDRSNYPDLYLMYRLTEADVVKDIMHLLQSYKVDAAIIDAGGRRVRDRLAAAANSQGTDIGKLSHLKTGNGIPKGYADIEATLAPDGRALFIEVKQPRCINQCGKVEHHEGEPSLEQLEFLRQKQARGALVMVAWSADDVEHYLNAELHRNRRVLQHGENEIRRHLAGTR
jgi:hypothetical protein